MTTTLDEFDTVWAPPNKAVDDNGATHDTVQSAVDNTGSAVLVGPGTYSESVTITTDGVSIFGVGRNTIIDGGTSGNAIFIDGANNCYLSNLAVKTTAGGGNNFAGVKIGGTSPDQNTLQNVWVTESDHIGLWINSGSQNAVLNCRVDDVSTVDGSGVVAGGAVAQQVGGCLVVGTGADGITVTSTKTVVGNNLVANCGADGIDASGNNAFISGFVVDNCNNGVRMSGTDQVLGPGIILNTTNTDIIESSATNLVKDVVMASGTVQDSGGGGSSWSQTTVTSNYTASADESVWVDASSSAVTVTAPTPSQGTEFRVVGIDDTNTITVARSGTENIEGVAEDITLAEGYAVRPESDGTNWWLNEGHLFTEAGTVTLSSGTATVDTGVTSTSAAFEVGVGVQDPNADADVVGRAFWDDSAGTHKVDILEDTTNVGNPTVNYTIERTKA